MIHGSASLNVIATDFGPTISDPFLRHSDHFYATTNDSQAIWSRYTSSTRDPTRPLTWVLTAGTKRSQPAAYPTLVHQFLLWLRVNIKSRLQSALHESWWLSQPLRDSQNSYFIHTLSPLNYYDEVRAIHLGAPFCLDLSSKLSS